MSAEIICFVVLVAICGLFIIAHWIFGDRVGVPGIPVATLADGSPPPDPRPKLTDDGEDNAPTTIAEDFATYLLAGFSILLVAIGLLGLLCFFFMDTTVATSGVYGQPERVYNMGAMSTRQTGLILSFLSFATGFISLVVISVARPTRANATAGK